MTYGVIPTGFSRKPLAVILTEMQDAMVAQFGPGVIQTSQSPLGQLNGLMADLTAKLWELGEDVYQSYDPDQAEGLRLDTLARIRILSRGVAETDIELRQAITNAGYARFDIQDLVRAIRQVDGVTYAQVFVNDTAAADANGVAAHSIAIAVIGGSDEDIAQVARFYIAPGIGTSGNTRVDVDTDGYCRTMWLMRLTAVPVKLVIEVSRSADNMGCPPPSLLSIAEGLVAALNGDRRFINGEDVTLFAIRSIIEAMYPNVEVVSVVADRDAIDSGSAVPLAIAFDEIATFAIEDVSVVNA